MNVFVCNIRQWTSAVGDDIIHLKDHRRFPKERGFMNISASAALDMDGFIHTLVQSISSALGPDVEIYTSEQKKNNQVTYPCLTIRHPDRKISPNIRIDELFDTYTKGRMDIEEITEKITEAYENISTDSPQLEDLCTNPRNVHDRIFFRLVNYERNSEILESYPFFRILDLAVTFCLSVDLPGEESGSIRIDNRTAEILGLDADGLLSLAVRNTPGLFPPEFEDLDALLLRIMREKGIPENMIPSFIGTDSFHTPMKVLSNNNGFYGASCILYPGVLEKIRNDLGMDYFIIPSSVNEVIIVPGDTTDYGRLRDMVRDVNATTIPPDQILSDNVYRYPGDFDSDTIRLFTGS